MSSSDSEQDFADYGTPLEPLEKDAIPAKKPVSLQDQVVRDSEGRIRFHGAFTGGFSAGFYNTVGSLEGWTPSEFKSSKSDKFKHVRQKPEDFMDDEDMGEFGIAPKVLRATADYASSSSTSKKRARPQFSDGPIPGVPVLKQLLQPVRETVGVKLLKRMGWKPGQGIGPRLSKTEKRQQKREVESGRKMYGCELPPQLQEDDNSSESDIEIDLDKINFAPDDYEPYICKPKDNSFGLGYVGLDRTPVLGGHINLFNTSHLKLQDKNRKVNIKGQAFGVGAFEEDDEDIYAVEDMSRYDFSIGKKDRPKEESRWEPDCSIEGFTKARSTLKKTIFSPPNLPQGYVPKHNVKTSRFEQTDAAVKKKFTSGERSVMINEKKREEAKDSVVVDAVLEEARKLTKELVSDVQDQSTFKPFAPFPDKQRRYEQYMKLLEIGQKERLMHLQPLSMTEWERNREKIEFDQASKLYRPLSGVMGDRFTTASQPDDVANPLASVERFKYGNEDEVNAAKLKMFGRLTRATTEWAPCSLLCKRYNVPQPGHGRSEAKQPTTKKQLCSLFDCLDQPTKKEEITEQTSEVDEPTAEPSTQVIEEEEDELNQLPTDKADLFKSIFLDSDEENETEKSNEPDTGPESFETNLFNIIPNVPNDDEPTGLFENLDFDLLNQRNVSKDDSEADSEVLDMYGPKLPDKRFTSSVGNNVGVVNSSKTSRKEVWVEKSVKKHKKDKKHKKHKHKHKKKS